MVCLLSGANPQPLALFAVKSKANWSSTVRFALLTGAVTTVWKPEQRFCFVCSDYLLGGSHTAGVPTQVFVAIVCGKDS